MDRTQVKYSAGVAPYAIGGIVDVYAVYPVHDRRRVRGLLELTNLQLDAFELSAYWSKMNW